MASTTPTVNQRVNEIKEEFINLEKSVSKMVSKASEKIMETMRLSRQSPRCQFQRYLCHSHHPWTHQCHLGFPPPLLPLIVHHTLSLTRYTQSYLGSVISCTVNLELRRLVESMSGGTAERVPTPVVREPPARDIRSRVRAIEEIAAQRLAYSEMDAYRA